MLDFVSYTDANGRTVTKRPDDHLEGAQSRLSDAVLPPLDQGGETAQERDARFERVRLRQKVQFAVSPGCSFLSPFTRRRLNEGDECTIAEFTIEQLNLLKDRGCVLWASPDEIRAASTPANVRFRVKSTILTRGKFLLENDEAKPEDFDGGMERIRELIARDLICENPEAT